ncbi:TRAP transporter permease [Pseudomonas sp. PA27(2017)]|uniref:TRAP transporter permease n=1 Tax=Pseudomonas sp. PA27(2017) TaxID=1932112 RepID=UPI00095CEA8D|nr:TRAP transporter permease [Pseudomonas sp. PA27(2017)]OLU24120.1 C4-dicarboxylate ABC transporter [Pseudomonas sp. PA27(2017)]
MNQQSAAELAAQETGARSPGGVMAWLIAALALSWSLFQLWLVSPLPFIFSFGIFNDAEARAIHLAFALALAFLVYPAFNRSPRSQVPWHDLLFALLAGAAVLYLFIFYRELASRPGTPTDLDLLTALIGIPLLLEATRRSLGPALAVIALVFLVYSVAGPWMPGMLSHRGVSWEALANHQWLSSEGVFGVALGVSTAFVFLFVLFGAMLDRAGAGHYFIQLAFSMLGHMRGGPAKASVIGSMLTSLMSGSSIANVVTTGPFTIPMMKKVGYPGTKAAAIEVAASTNGQMMPPVMGAAAFLMIEYVGIPYVEVLKHALLPATISYITLLWLVHLEAVKLGMAGLPRPTPKPILLRLMTLSFGIALVSALALAVYYGLGWLKPLFGDYASWVIAGLIAVAYLVLIRISAGVEQLAAEDPETALTQLPDTRKVFLSGLHFLLPMVILVWCLMVERLSPGLSAFWGVLSLIVILVTQRPLLNLMRRDPLRRAGTLRNGLYDLYAALQAGARGMIGIGVATATAGIVVGAISQTGVGIVLADLVETLSMGNLLLMLVLTGVFCVVLGLGLPTTANYIVVSSLMAPVIVSLGQQHGLVVPLIAVHMFVFYFGLLADSTPPVGLASFAAAAIARDDPIKTGIQAFIYDARSIVWPFMFIFNTDLLLIDVTVTQGIITFFSATLAMLVFASATQGWFITRNRWFELPLLLLISFTLFRPDFWLDRVIAPYQGEPPARFAEALREADPGDDLRLVVRQEEVDGSTRDLTVMFKVPDSVPEERLEALGLTLYEEGERTLIDAVGFRSAAERAGLQFDQEVLELQMESHRPPKEIMWIPAVLLLGLLGWLQLRRAKAQQLPQTLF